MNRFLIAYYSILFLLRGFVFSAENEDLNGYMARKYPHFKSVKYATNAHGAEAKIEQISVYSSKQGSGFVRRKILILVNINGNPPREVALLELFDTADEIDWAVKEKVLEIRHNIARETPNTVFTLPLHYFVFDAEIRPAGKNPEPRKKPRSDVSRKSEMRRP